MPCPSTEATARPPLSFGHFPRQRGKPSLSTGAGTCRFATSQDTFRVCVTFFAILF